MITKNSPKCNGVALFSTISYLSDILREEWNGGCWRPGPTIKDSRLSSLTSIVFTREPALWQSDYDHDGFNWLDCSDHENSVLSFVRQNLDRTSKIVVIMNLTPVPRFGYRLGLPMAGKWEEVLNSDAGIYGGGNVGNLGGVSTQPITKHGHPQSAELTLPPLSVIAFKPQQEKAADVSAPKT